MNKKINLVFGLIISSTLLGGGVFAIYTVKDSANKEGIAIHVDIPRFYLDSVDEANELTYDWVNTYSSEQITFAYNATHSIVDEGGISVGSYTATTSGKYVLTYNYSTSAFNVDVISKDIYLNFASMENGGTNGRVWNQFYCYAWNSDDDSIKNAAWPGVEMTAIDGNGHYVISIPGACDKVIFNNNGGDDQGHVIQTATLDYDITKPLFECTSNTCLNTFALNETPEPDDTFIFDYYLHTSHNEWAALQSCYGFEKVHDESQYLLRCYLEDGDELGVRDTGSGWWGKDNLGNSGSGFTTNDSNILITADGWYNIYFKPSENKIYID